MYKYIYYEITGAKFGLKSTGYIANQDLIKHIAPNGYHPSNQTPGLWLHKIHPISFTLVVNDFSVKYMNKKDINHLSKERYKIKIDWNGSKYLGIDLKWHYNEGYVILSMKGYVKKALREFLHRTPSKPVYGPTKYN